MTLNQKQPEVGGVYKAPPASDDWSLAKEVDYDDSPVYKQCEGVGCPNRFVATWPKMRRCPRCRKEKRPYRDPDQPF